jgi:hypothetical protein
MMMQQPVLFTLCALCTLPWQGDDHIAELVMLNVTGVPARVRTHEVTKQVEYIGDVQNLVEKLSDLPAGGQVLMGPLTYQRIYSRLEEFRIHSLQKSYEQPARSAPLCTTYPTFVCVVWFAKPHFKTPSMNGLRVLACGDILEVRLKSISRSRSQTAAWLLPAQSHC